MPPDSSNTDVSQQQPAVDATAGDAGQPGAGADLTFALKLTPQQTLDSTAAPRQPEAVDAGDAAGSQRAKTTQTQNSPPSALALNKDNALPAQDGISVKGNTAPKEPAAVVSPAKGARQNDAGQDTAHSGPRDQTPNVQTPPIPVPVKAAAAYSASATPSASEQPHLETAAKALDATPVQVPASEQAGVKTPGPLKDLAMQVGQTAHDKVELRVVDRSGELQVTVRASNPDLAQGLRQGLSDLVDRLEQNGFRAEAWRPGTAANSVPVTGDARQRPPQFQNEGGQPQSGGSQQGRQQNGQNQSRPRWVQELEGTLTGGQSSFQGESYGISR